MPDYNKLSDIDLSLIVNGRADEISEAAKRYLAGEEFGTMETLGRSAERGFTSFGRGIAGFFGTEANDENELEDKQKEAEWRMMTDTNPVAAYTGFIGGSILDPFTIPAAFLKPIKFASATGTMAARGAVAGAAGGAVEPIYSEYGDSRALNVAAGTAFGGALGGAIGKIFGKSDVEGKVAKAEVDDAAKAETSQANAVDEILGIEEPIFPAGKNVEWDEATQSMAVVEDVVPDFNLNLPRTLAGAKPRFNKFKAEFDNDIDKALYIIGDARTKSKAHDAYVAWLQEVTGLDEANLKTTAQKARKELGVSLSRADKGDDVLTAPASSVATRIIEAKRQPVRTVTPVQPSRLKKVDNLGDPADLDMLKRAGIEVRINKSGSATFHHANKPNKPFMNGLEVDSRLRAAGIELDLPSWKAALKEMKRQADEMGPKQPTRDAIVEREFWSDKPDPKLSKQAWTDKPIKTKEEIEAEIVPTQAVAEAKAKATAAPEPIAGDAPMTGRAEQPRSAGSAGVDPKAQYANEFSEAFMPPGATRMPTTELINRSLSFEDARKMFPKEGPDALSDDNLRAALATLKRIVREKGSIEAWMLSKARRKSAMTREEATAFEPFYRTVMLERERVLDDLAAKINARQPISDAELEKAHIDILYYDGIRLFKKNEGTKASRALSSFKLLTDKALKNENVKRLFPNVSC